jgi:mRNA-degrading endonuclease toxin of MazEF toxin-antitoxin module
MEHPWMLASSPASILNRIFGRAGIPKRESGQENHALAVPSWVMVEKIASIRRERTREVLGCLSATEMVALGQSLAVLLGFG